MVVNGFMRCNYDCCVYFKMINGSVYVYLLLYVDDMLLSVRKCIFIKEKIVILHFKSY